MLKLSIIGLSLCVLTGCVTEYDKPARIYDKQSALESNVKLGMSYLDQGSRENASRAFVRALEIDKKSAEAHQGMAILHQLNGESDRAEESFKKALKGDADFSMSSVKVSYGRFLVDQERYNEALAFFEEASGDVSYPSRAEAFYLIGDAALMLGDKVRAKAAFIRSLNIDPKFASSMLALAKMMFEDERYEKAKQYLDLFTRNSDVTAASLWLGIRIEHIFENKDKEASYALALKNRFPYSKEYLSYKKLENKK